MQNNDITKFLGLKGLTVIKYDKKDEGHFFMLNPVKHHLHVLSVTLGQIT